MLIKYKDVTPKKRRKKPFEKCFHVCGVIKNFFGEGASNFDIFSSRVFPGRILLKHIENEKGFRGVRGHAPRKIFEGLHIAVTILVLFEQILDKFCLNFLPLSLSALPNRL